MIQQGDQYKIEIGIKFNGVAVTPTTENLEDVRIQFGKYLFNYADGGITYENAKWLFPMTEEMSRANKGQVTMQVGLKFTGEVWKYSADQMVQDNTSLITESWATNDNI